MNHQFPKGNDYGETDMLISIIIPVRNEQNYIQSCIESVLAFEIPEGYTREILILDGMSEDSTLSILHEKFTKEGITIVPNPGKIRPTALNPGIRLSKGEYIMVLDAHAKYPVTYLKDLIDTSERVGAENVGGICVTHPGGQNYGAQVVQALTTHRFGVGNSGFRVGFKEGYCDTVPYGFYRREVFEHIGLFDERLKRSQDYEFNRRLTRSGGKIWQNPEIKIDYYNQEYFSKFILKQLTAEGPGNAYMWYLAPYTLSIRHLITSIFAGTIIAGGILAWTFPVFLPVYLTILLLYLLCAGVASVQQSRRYRIYRHSVFLPFGFFLFHFSHGMGTLTGLVRILAGAAPVVRLVEPWKGAVRNPVKITYALVLLIAFFIPVYGKILPWLIFVVCVNWLFGGAWLKTFRLLFREKTRRNIISFSLLYLLYLAGMAWTSNMPAGWFDIVMKLPLFIFPVVFATAGHIVIQREKLNMIFNSFIAGCLFSCLLLIGHASYSQLIYSAENAFYYENLSWYHSPIYFAMYLAFAFSILLWRIVDGACATPRCLVVHMLLLAGFFIFIMLLNSKAGYLSLLVIVVFFTLYLVGIKRKWLSGLGVIVCSTAMFIGFLWLFPYTGKRLSEASQEINSVNSQTREPKSTAQRLMVWRCSSELVKENLFAGVGSGDVKDALMKKYSENRLKKPLSEKLNAHNQYLQTFIAIGIAGFLLLVFMLLLPAIGAIRHKDYFYFLFLVIIALNLMFESMFERQGGVFFYAFFNALLFISYSSDPADNSVGIF